MCYNIDTAKGKELTQMEKVKTKYDNEAEYQIHLKIKCKHKVIFNCYTDRSDSYYPLGNINYDLTQLRLKYDK